jgi:hypothetical protein
MDVVVFVVVLCASLAVTHLLERRRGRELRELIEHNARMQLEVIRHLRRTMEDLQRRDPQIAEMVEFQLGELDRTEPYFAAFAQGDYQEVRRLTREARRRGA